MFDQRQEIIEGSRQLPILFGALLEALFGAPFGALFGAVFGAVV
mgnify:CR=1 FL=1